MEGPRCSVRFELLKNEFVFFGLYAARGTAALFGDFTIDEVGGVLKHKLTSAQAACGQSFDHDFDRLIDCWESFLKIHGSPPAHR